MMCNAFAHRYSVRFSLGSSISNMLSLITSIFPTLAPLCSRVFSVKSPVLKVVDEKVGVAVGESYSAAWDKLTTATVAISANLSDVERDVGDGIYLLPFATMKA